MYYLSILTSQRFMDQIIISNLQLMVILVCIPGSEQRSKCMLLLLKKKMTGLNGLPKLDCIIYSIICFRSWSSRSVSNS